MAKDRRGHRPLDETDRNLEGLNNLGLEPVARDFSDSPFAEAEVSPEEIDALNDDE